MSNFRSLSRSLSRSLFRGGRLPIVAAVGAVFAVVSATHADQSCAPAWVSTFTSLPGLAGSGVNVSATLNIDDGVHDGPALYVAGSFTRVLGVPVNSIARFDGNEWTALGSGLDGAVRAMTMHDDGSGAGPQLYIGGSFLNASGVAVNRIARWDGSAWQPVGPGFNGPVNALASFDDGNGAHLYAGGEFSNLSIPGILHYHIARWNGAQWSILGGAGGAGLGGVTGAVHAFKVFDDGNGESLFLAGDFNGFYNSWSMTPAQRIARWDGQLFHTMGEGESAVSFNGSVRTLTLLEASDGVDELWAGGGFTLVNGESMNRIARWTETTGWTPVGDGFDDGLVLSIARFEPEGDAALGEFATMYAGGTFEAAGGAPAKRLARFDGSQWIEIGGGLDQSVEMLAVYPETTTADATPQLFVGGSFNNAGSVYATKLVVWDGDEWQTLGGGLNDAVRVLEEFDDGSGSGPALFAAGSFTSSGTQQLGLIARWNDQGSGSGEGPGWTALPGGFNSAVSGLAVIDAEYVGGKRLVAVGSFTQAGPTMPANRIALFDGESWSTPWPGTNGLIASVVTKAGPGPRLAGSGLADGIYVGGSFSLAGGQPAPRVALYNGEGWSSVGGGVTGGNNPTVLAMALFDDGLGDGPVLYVGGLFTTAGTGPSAITVSNIARFDGTTWSDVGGGTNNLIRAMAVMHGEDGPTLLVGGHFSTAGGHAAPRLAKWNGTAWTPMLTQMNEAIYGIAVDDSRPDDPAIYIGGTFTQLNGSNYQRVAKWQDGAWSSLGTGIFHSGSPSAYVRALRIQHDEDGTRSVLVGGLFHQSPAGDTMLARWRECPIVDPSVEGDLNGDGVVDGADLGMLLSAWGACDGCLADLNGDGVVDGADLGILLANWG